MDDPWLTTLFALARAVHFGACLLLLCVPLFDRLMIGSLPASLRGATERRWRRIALVLVLLAAPVALISGGAWLGFVAIEMSGLPLGEALTWETLNLVWSQTHFGRLWELRAIFWFAAGVPALLSVGGRIAASFSRVQEDRTDVTSVPRDRTRVRAILAWIAVLAGICFVSSLAWAGHGLTGLGVAVHLPADLIHLVVCALWPVGLLPFALVLRCLRNSPEQFASESIVAITRRFSLTSLICVAVLAASGVINSWSLVGPVANFWRSDYGRLLSLKIILFIVMFIFGARNLLHWKPLLVSDRVADRNEIAARQLLRNVMLELILSIAVILVVGYLGLMMPSFQEHPLHHHSDDATTSDSP